MYAPKIYKPQSRQDFWKLLGDVLKEYKPNENVIMLRDYTYNFMACIGVSHNGCERVLGKFGTQDWMTIAKV